MLEFTSIPDTWASVLLGREVDPVLSMIRNGLTLPQDKNKGSYKITRIETIGDGYINEDRVRYVSNVSKETVEKYLIRKDDILFSHINSDPHIGKTAIATHDYPDLLHGMNLLLLRPNSEVVEPYFLHSVFCFYRQIGVFIKICARAVNQSSINQEKLRALEIPLPPITEQQRITYVLSTVQTAIEQQERLIKLTRELKSALMHKLFTEGLHAERQKMTEIGPVPKSWEIKPFETFTTLQRGKDLTKNEFKGGNIPVAGSNGIIGYHNTAFVKGPGVTVGRSGSTGKVIFYEQDFWAHNTSLYVKDFHDNDPRFAAYYLEILNLGRFKTGASVPTLDRNAFKHLPITVPKKEEQIEIGRIIMTIDNKIELANAKKVTLEELFRTLLNQLMTGQIRVNEIDLPGFS